jgi:TatD DNase family protein
MAWIDMHCHFPMLELTSDEIIAQAKSEGVERMITIGTEPGDHETVFEVAKKHFPIVACTLGVHPHEAKLYNDEVKKYLYQRATDPVVVAIGEIGLDYFYNKSEHDIQRQAFISQLEIAQDLNLPVQIHTRDAEEDTVEILKRFGGKIRGTIHCFTGTENLADECLKLGLDISFSGIVTFKNAQDLKSVAAKVPLDRMHVETDAPFLTPVPFRGKKNTPAFVRHTGEFVANLRTMLVEDFQKQMKINALRTFPKLSW